MSSRQLPLFPNQITTLADVSRHTQLQHTLALFQEHLKKEGKSEHTIKAFTADLMLLAEYSGADKPIGQFTTTLLNDFLYWLENGRGVPCSRKSYARRVTSVKVYFKWLQTVGALAHDPAKAVLQRSGPAPLATILSPEDIEAALAYARSLNQGEKADIRPLMLFRLILDTGIKKGEASRLTLAHIHRENAQEPTLEIKHKVRNVYKERHIPLFADWLPILDEYRSQYAIKDLVFTCTARNLEYVLSAISDGANLPMKISFEMLRWNCAVRDYQAGMEPNDIREKLGLSEASWTETFSKIKRLAEQQSPEALDA